MSLRHCKSRKCLVQNFVLGKVQTFIDPRAHLVQGELRYSIKVGRKWHRKLVDAESMTRLFEDLNP